MTTQEIEKMFYQKSIDEYKKSINEPIKQKIKYFLIALTISTLLCLCYLLPILK